MHELVRRSTAALLVINAIALGGCGGSGDSPNLAEAGAADASGSPAGDANGNSDGGADTGAQPDADSGPVGPHVANDPPTARGETFYTQPGAAVSLGDLLANDVDPDGDPLTLSIARSPAHGALTLDVSGHYVYTPANGFTGEDSFAYSASDAHGASDETDVYVYAANATYYVAETGDDTRAGTSPATAWKTLAKVNSSLCSNAIVAGDVILLARGATFHEKFTGCNRTGSAGRPIVFGAYGTGAAPTISGSDPATGWTVYSGNIWQTTVASPVKQVYFNGTRQQPARFPNAGWFKNAAGSLSSAPTTVNAPDLVGTSGSYAGATIRIRTTNWSYETRTITDSSPGSVTIDSPFIFDVMDGDWGYFVDGKLSFLDAPGEWFYDDASHTLYFRAPGDVDPNTAAVEASVRDRAIDVYNAQGVATNLTFDGIAAEHAYEAAVAISYQNSHATFRRVDIRDSYWGLRAFSDDVDVVEATITRTLDNGIWLQGARDRLVRSTLQDIAVVPGYGTSYWGYLGAELNGDAVVARHNVVDNVGYIGLLAEGTNGTIEQNLVRHSNAVLNDGSSVGFDHCDGVTVSKNVVVDPLGTYLDTVSQLAGPWKSPYARIVFGIYFGNTSVKNTHVDANIAAGGKAGIIVDHTMNSTGNAVTNNLFFDNYLYQLYATDMSQSACRSSYGETYTGNVLVPGAADQTLFFQHDVKCHPVVDWGTIDQNTYATLYSDDVVLRESLVDGSDNATLTLPAWQAASGKDGASHVTPAVLKLASGVKPVLHYNAARGPRVIAPAGAWRTIDGSDVTGPITIGAYEGLVLFPK